MASRGIWLGSVALFAGALGAAAPAACDWTARRVYDPLKDQSRCVAESDVVRLHDGYQETFLRLRVDQRSVSVVTESNIDATKPDAGIVVDDHSLVPFDSLTLEQTAVFEKHAAALIAQFKVGRAATVRLHFWPTWAPKGLKSATVSLQGFTRAYVRLPDCS
jgi:hypothetical protein